MKKIKTHLLVISSLIYIAILGYLDYISGPYISFVILYLIPIVTVTWFAPRWVTLPLTASAISWFFDDIISPYKYNHPFLPYWNVIWKILSFVFIIYIIDRLRENTIQLKMSEEACRSIFESANDAIIVRDIKTYRIIDANSRACELFCYAKKEIIGLDLGTFTGDSRQYTKEKIRELYGEIAAGKPRIFEWLVKDKFGREFWVEISAKRAVIGGQYRIILVTRDITERKQMMDTKDNFVNMVSHELRTPLSAVKEAIALAMSEKKAISDTEQKELLEIAKRNIDRLGRLINQVLDFQKLDSSALEFEFKENNINDVIREVNSTMISAAAGKRLELILKLDEKLPNTKFDRDRIIEVLTNLVDNAIKYTEKGSITITSLQQGDSIRVSVEDTGFGIKEENMPKLFQRFAQLERKTGGSGLGLAISKEIIEMHKGEIWAESKFGKGTVINFLLPIVK